mmetsp:Transcript_32449/g.73320  ORF Transcript_32449/g.73320 Transcript_32449/m.73320 type:complete len:287 (+) Transcript_32449:570-1430(+)
MAQSISRGTTRAGTSNSRIASSLTRHSAPEVFEMLRPMFCKPRFKAWLPKKASSCCNWMSLMLPMSGRSSSSISEFGAPLSNASNCCNWRRLRRPTPGTVTLSASACEDCQERPKDSCASEGRDRVGCKRPRAGDALGGDVATLRGSGAGGGAAGSTGGVANRVRSQSLPPLPPPGSGQGCEVLVALPPPRKEASRSKVAWKFRSRGWAPGGGAKEAEDTARGAGAMAEGAVAGAAALEEAAGDGGDGGRRCTPWGAPRRSVASKSWIRRGPSTWPRRPAMSSGAP